MRPPPTVHARTLVCCDGGICAFARGSLAKGLDDIDISMQRAAAIDVYEKAHTATATLYDHLDVKYYCSGR